MALTSPHAQHNLRPCHHSNMSVTKLQKMHKNRTLPALAILALALAPLGTMAQAPVPKIPVAKDQRYEGTIVLNVDATDLDHRIFQVQQQIPVKPGALTLFFPRWLPGTHGPTGVVDRQTRSPWPGCATPPTPMLFM